MGKNKLRRFEENKSFAHLLQPHGSYPFEDDPLKGRWNGGFFSETRPIVLELGCGRGEYTVNLAQHDPACNYVGIDIKGSRMWRGAKTVHEEKLGNVGFLRVQIERIENFFAPGEVSEIWITFPDPQPQQSREKKRLTSPRFISMYRKIMKPGGIVHLKTDNAMLFEYTLDIAGKLGLHIEKQTNDLYGSPGVEKELSIQTTYEKIFLEQNMKICYLRLRL